MKKITSLAIILVLILAFFSCNAEETEEERMERENFPVELEGGYTLYEAPQRVISLSPSVTEIIFALGSYSQLIAVSDNCNHPAQVLDLPKMGTALSPNVDEIVALNPDLILTSTPVFGITRDRLALRNIPVVVLPAAASSAELQEIYEQIAAMLSGNYTGPLNAENVLTNMFLEMERLTEPVDFTAIILPNLHFAPDSSYLLNSLVESAGFNLPEIVESEDDERHILQSVNSDFIFTTPIIAAQIMNDERFRELTAVTNERVVGLDPELFERQGARLIELVETMSNVAARE